MQLILDEDDIDNLPKEVKTALLRHLATRFSGELTEMDAPVADAPSFEEGVLRFDPERLQLETIPNKFVRYIDRPLLKFANLN